MDDTALIIGNEDLQIGRSDRELSSQPELSLTWCNLSVWIKKKISGPFWKRRAYENHRILNNVNGVVKSGTLMAILGASGAGKTTLLATLSQRMKVGKTEGDVLVNGCKISHHLMNKMSGFTPQRDLTVASITVVEHMLFMARLMMDKEDSLTIRYQRINGLLRELSLTKCKDTRLSALSGGEKKRLSLAVQLLTDPALLFCDEPTTGLDSYSAHAVIEKLRLFASRGKAVICTIHQPTSGIFDKFAKVFLLADGRVAFHGDVKGAEHHFASLGLVCPPTYNRAEFYVHQLAVIPGKEEASVKKINRLCDSFTLSKHGQALSEELTMNNGRQSSILMQPFSQKENANLDSHYLSKYTTSRKVNVFVQFYWLAWRNVTGEKRNFPKTIMQMCVFWLVGLVISTPYHNIQRNQQGIQSLQGLMYLLVTETVFSFAYYVTHTFPGEMPISLREIGNDLYKPAPYYLSKVIILIPLAVVGPSVFGTIAFCMADLNGGIIGLLWLCLPIVMCAMTANAYGCMISAMFERLETATLASVPFDVIAISLSGIFIKLSTLPVYLSWLPYVSQFYYGVEGVSIAVWGNIDHIECPANGTVSCITNGAAVLAQYDYNVNDFNLDIGCQFTFYCVAHILGFLFFWRRSKKQPVY